MNIDPSTNVQWPSARFLWLQKNRDIGVTTFYPLLTAAGPVNRCPLTMGVSDGQKLDHIQHILFTAVISVCLPQIIATHNIL